MEPSCQFETGMMECAEQRPRLIVGLTLAIIRSIPHCVGAENLGGPFENLSVGIGRLGLGIGDAELQCGGRLTNDRYRPPAYLTSDHADVPLELEFEVGGLRMACQFGNEHQGGSSPASGTAGQR